MAGVPQAPDRISLPKLVQDPVWSLCQWPAVVDVLGEDLTIPAAPAVDWLRVLMATPLNLEGIFPGMLCVEDQNWIDELIFTERISFEELQDLQLEILGTVAARPWYVAARIIGLVRDVWDKVALEILTSADATKLSLSGWLDIAYLSLIRAMEQNKIQMFVSQLVIPPVGYATEDPQELEMSAGSFLALGG